MHIIYTIIIIISTYPIYSTVGSFKRWLHHHTYHDFKAFDHDTFIYMGINNIYGVAKKLEVKGTYLALGPVALGLTDDIALEA